MRRLLLCAGLVISMAISAFAQNGNEWINPGQPYFKISVAKNGIYKLTTADLQAAGVPVASVDAKTLQLFHRGEEQSIYVEGENDSQLDGADFIEFYGLRNDGTLDASLYKPASYQPHNYYNLYSDTTCYFLTFNAQPGKRMTFFDESGSPSGAKETFHLDEKLLVLTQNYSAGFIIEDIQNTYFDQGEGWTGAQVAQNQTIDYTLTDILQSAQANGSPVLDVLIVGRWDVPHQVEVYVGPTTASLRLLATVASFAGYQTKKFSQNIDWSDIGGDGKLVVRIKPVATSSRASASYIRLTYPQGFNSAGATEKVFQLTSNGSGKSYIEIENAASGLRLFDITDPSSVSRVGTTVSSSLQAVVSSTNTPRKIFATSVTTTPSIKKVSFRQIIPAQHDFIIISHKKLMRPGGTYSDPVRAYGGYRASTAGGSYDTLVVDMDMLYDEFSYGEKTPLAIYNFMKFLVNSHVPQYLFFIGKGLQVSNGYFRNPTAFTNFQDLVPPSGFPASDIAFTAGLNGTTYEPAVPTGRIPSQSPAEVAAYLDKVKETEATPLNDLWRKNILHLSGGIEEGEPEAFREIMVGFQDIAEGYHLGGKVTPIFKRSREIGQLIDVSAQVNKGLGLITFFGHSSPGTLDFDVGFVTNPVLGYNNKGKYPMFLINGCNAGSFFLNGKIFGEDWINAADKGAIGFIAHSYYGFVSTLEYYSQTFYSVGYGDSTYIYKGIGDIQKETARRYMLAASPSFSNVTQVQQMILLGDPSVKLFGARKADYEVNANNLAIESFDENPVTALSDSFALKIIVRNFGQAKEDTFRIEVKRRYNDNTEVTYDSLFAPIFYSDTILFKIYKDRNAAYGNNTFTVNIDPDDVVNELDETNNTATLGLVIPLNGTRNLFPYNYAIVNRTSTSLSFQSTDVLSGPRSFNLEVDTVNTFDSPYKKQFTVTGTVLARQNFTLLENDSLVYYWRTKLADPLPEESSAWEMSSFTFINEGPEGWAQMHFPQYLEDAAVGLVKDPELRRLHYEQTVTGVYVKTYGASHPSVLTDISVKIAGAEYNLTTQGFNCRYNTLNLIAFDRSSTVPYIGVPFKWYNRAGRACGREPWVINSYAYSEMAVGNGLDLVAYVDNIAPGDSVLLYTVGDASYNLWPIAAKAKLGELGISIAQIESFLPGEAVVIFGKKGLVPGTASIYRTSVSPENQQTVEVNKTITGGYSSGTMTSPRIGPALHWSEFVLQTSEVGASDEFTFDVIGVGLDGEENVIMQGLMDDVSLENVNAEDYPYIKLRFHSSDNVDLTSVQLNKWIVVYDPVPDGLLVFKGTRTQQHLFEGQSWTGQYGFINITDKTFSDPLPVAYEQFNTLTRTSSLQNFTITAPAPGDTTWFDIGFASEGKSGLNDINVFVNKRVLPEQYYENNVLELSDYVLVETDNFDPVLDVTVDGRYLANRDYVSANPVIEAKVWDENRFRLQTDTLGVTLFLGHTENTDVTAECGEMQQIYFSRNDVSWFPATESSDFRMVFSPSVLPEGKYCLRVEANDVSGNTSGSAAYEVTFIVDYEATTQILPPYPNPFGVNTTFTVILSGETDPSDYSLTVMNVNGKVVGAFDQQTTPLSIGTNRIGWNGADASGNYLPNGVYVYRLLLNSNGQAISKTGKIVLLR